MELLANQGTFQLPILHLANKLHPVSVSSVQKSFRSGSWPTSPQCNVSLSPTYSFSSTIKSTNVQYIDTTSSGACCNVQIKFQVHQIPVISIVDGYTESDYNSIETSYLFEVSFQFLPPFSFIMSLEDWEVTDGELFKTRAGRS